MDVDIRGRLVVLTAVFLLNAIHFATLPDDDIVKLGLALT
jgi:hypothetical protein